MKNIFNSILITIFLSTLLSAKNDETIQSELIQLKTSQEYAEKLTNEKITLIMGQIIQKEDELKELRNKLEESKLEKEKIKKDFENYNEKIEWQNKRIEDLNLYLTLYGFLITALLFIASYLSYRFTSSNANKIVNNWIKENKEQILAPIKEEAKEFQQNIENEALKFYQEQLKEFKIDDKLDTSLQLSQREILQKVNDILDKREKEEYTFDDWFSKYLTFRFKDNKKALIFINKAIKHSTSDKERISAMFSKAKFLTDIDDKSKILEGIKVYDEISKKFKNSNDDGIENDRLISMYNRGIAYLKLEDREKEIESYDSFLNDCDDYAGKNNLASTILNALLNKIESKIIVGKDIQNDLYLVKKFDLNNESNLIITILELIEKAKNESQDTEIEKVQLEYKNVKIRKNWSFNELKTWANSFEDEKVKERLLKYLNIFENHNKNIKED